MIDALEDNLVDGRNPLRTSLPGRSAANAGAVQLATGWIDLSDTDTLRRDPLWQLAGSDARGMTPLA